MFMWFLKNSLNRSLLLEVFFLKMVLLFRILISLLDFLFMCMWASWYFHRG